MKYTVGRFRSREPAAATYLGADEFIAGQSRGRKVLFHDDDPVNTVTVLESRSGRAILNNGKSDGHTSGDYPTMCFASLIPALLTDDPSHGFVIGWGTGISAGELAALDGAKSIEVAEISPAVMDGAPFFRPFNLQADLNPKVHVLRRDAYRALLRSEGRYGIIMSEPSNPWVTGVEMLFSQEFLSAARAKLTPGGVYAQWFHLYEVDEETVEIVAATYTSVFDRVSVWFTTGPDVLLMGFNGDSLPSLETLRARAERPDMKAGLARCGARSLPEVLAHELIPPGLVHGGNVSARIHTLRHPILSQHAARAFFAGRRVDMPRLAGGPDASDDRPRALLADLLGDGPVPEEIASAVTRHICDSGRAVECTTWLARWRHDHPDSAEAFRYDPRRIGQMQQVALLEPESVARIGSLFDGRPVLDPRRQSPLARAGAMTGIFSSMYVHAIPFDRRALRTVWNECTASREDAAAQCQTQRLRANSQFQRFELPRP